MTAVKKTLRILNIILRALIVITVVLLAALNIYILVQRYGYGNDMPTVFGLGSAVVVSGSMDTGENPETDIRVGDLVVIKSKDEYSVGEVITFKDAYGSFTTHRITAVGEDGTFTTKGDANNAEDKFAVPKGDVVGKVVAVFKGFGNVITFFQSPLGLLVIIVCGVALWLVTVGVSALLGRDKSKKAER